MLKIINQFWGWSGLDAVEILATNAFGNVMARASDEAIWRICPEELSCERIACNASEFKSVWNDISYQRDWQMTAVVILAVTKFGEISADRCFCLKVPATLGGAYEPSNLGTITRAELLSFTGNLAREIRNLPGGAQVKIRTT